MKGTWLCIAAALLLASLIPSCGSEDTRSFSTPFIDLRSPEKSRNIHVPQVTYEPLILIQLINPATKKSLKGFGYLDTGSDQCFISKEMADRLGLKPEGQPPHEMQTAGGKVLLSSTMIEYALADPNGEPVKGFPVQTAPFFIQDGWLPADLVLGSIGFLDRFKKIQISYPKELTLTW